MHFIVCIVESALEKVRFNFDKIRPDEIIKLGTNNNHVVLRKRKKWDAMRACKSLVEENIDGITKENQYYMSISLWYNQPATCGKGERKCHWICRAFKGIPGYEWTSRIRRPCTWCDKTDKVIRLSCE